MDFSPPQQNLPFLAMRDTDHTRKAFTNPIRLKWQHLGITILFGLTLVMIQEPAHAHECEELVKMHGLLGRAFIQCHFTFYSRGFVIQAEACASKIGDKAFKQGLAEGKEAFETRSIQMGQPALCSKILKDFPYTVRQ